MGVIEQGIFDSDYAAAVHVFHNAAQSVAVSGTLTWLAFNSERFDTFSNAADTMHDTVTNNNRLTCRYAGIYQITGIAEFAANATGLRQLTIRHQGTTDLAANATLTLGAGIGTNVTVTTLCQLAVNEYVELGALQTSGGALNVNSSGNRSPEFMMVKVA